MAAAAVVVVVAAAVADKKRNIKIIIMKKLIIHSIPVVISFIWLFIEFHTFNPVILTGSGFLKFYLILILGFYLSGFILKSLKESISTTTFYFALFIFLLGIIKLIRGILLEKPVGFLVMILIGECIVMLMFKLSDVKDNIKH